MRRLMTLVGLTLALAGSQSVAALASPGVGLPEVPAHSPTVPPPGFSSNAVQAIAAAKNAPRMRALHARWHPLRVEVFIWKGQRWYVDFAYRGKLVAEVDVKPSGRVAAVWTGPLALAVYARGGFASLYDSWWVLIPASILFLVPFLDLRRPRRLLHLDALVLLSFLISFSLFERTQLEAAVWLVYPPLIYLLGRMLALGLRSRRPSPALVLPSAPVLGTGLVLLLAARVGLSLVNREVIDVGYASVIGAHRLLHGQGLYYASAMHADTYGPIAYLAYVPFELLFPWRGAWDYLISAHVASIVFDLITVTGLIIMGRRLRPAAEGRRLGLALAWAWSACPFTLLPLMMHSNDGLVAMLSVLGLVVFASPPARGAALALAAAAKFTPAALLPLFAGDRRGGRKGIAACVGAFALVGGAAIVLALPAGGVPELYDHTIGYQLGRADVFSLWGLHRGLQPLKIATQVLAVGFACGLAFWPRERSLTRVAALAAAVTIAVQLPAEHWFYYYLIWLLPFALVALLGREAGPRPGPEKHASGATSVEAGDRRDLRAAVGHGAVGQPVSSG